MNLSGTLHIFKLFYNPALCKPNLVVSSFNQLPIPINENIKAVVLDKDNCISYPKKSEIWPDYLEKWELLKKNYPGKSLLIVSNSAGSSDDIDYKEAKLIEEKTGVPVFRHSTKKPGCHEEILKYFYENDIIKSPNEVAVVGDRLFTDIIMANLMKSYGVWIRDGVIPSNNILCRIEKYIYKKLK